MSRVQHVTPIADDREHSESRWCWCVPDGTEVDAGGATIWIHHSADLREAYEQATGESFRGKTWAQIEVEED